MKGNINSRMGITPAGGMENVMSHTFHLAQLIYSSLKHLCHHNAQSAIQLYADTDYSDPSTQGPIVAFNVLDTQGKVVGYSQVRTNIFNDFLAIYLNIVTKITLRLMKWENIIRHDAWWSQNVQQGL